MNNDDIYGLNQTSPLRSIYDRGSRQIYSTTQKNVSPATTNATMQRASTAWPETEQLSTNVKFLEAHLKALHDIDRRLALLNQRDDMLQQKVVSQEAQLNSLQHSVQTLFQQTQLLSKVQLSAPPTQTPVPIQQQQQTVADEKIFSDVLSVPPNGSTNNILIIIGVGIILLLVLIFAFLLARWQKQINKENESKKALEMQQNVKQAVYDVLSQSQTSNRLNNSSGINLTNSQSFPFAFGP